MENRLHISNAHRETLLGKLMRSAKRMTSRRNLISMPEYKRKRLTSRKEEKERVVKKSKESLNRPDSVSGNRKHRSRALEDSKRREALKLSDSRSGNNQHRVKDLRSSLRTVKTAMEKMTARNNDSGQRKVVFSSYSERSSSHRRNTSPFWDSRDANYLSCRRERRRQQRDSGSYKREDEERRGRLRGIASMVTRRSPPVTRRSINDNSYKKKPTA